MAFCNVLLNVSDCQNKLHKLEKFNRKRML